MAGSLFPLSLSVSARLGWFHTWESGETEREEEAQVGEPLCHDNNKNCGFRMELGEIDNFLSIESMLDGCQ